MDLYDRLHLAASVIAETTGSRHEVAVVLGSGMGVYATGRAGAVTVPYGDIPGFPIPGATAHAGVATSCLIGGRRVLLLAGRIHWYEGRTMEEVAFAVRAAILAGSETAVLTNAAGGCGPGLRRGDLVVIRDHLNLAGVSPLAGPNDGRLGPRWPDMTDMTDVCTAALRTLAGETAEGLGVPSPKGCTPGLPGRCSRHPPR